MSFRRLLSALFLALSAVPAAQAGTRQVQALIDGWQFQLGEEPQAAQPDFDDGQWQRVSLPHDWNRMGGSPERRSDYQNVHGPGWYRLHFRTPADLGRQRVWLQFDGASIVTDVWVNGRHLGQHAGAFARFRFDATDALKPTGDNVLAVRVDNSSPREAGSPTAEVIPMSGDWPMYGGLYRGVSLVLTAPLHIAMRDFGGPGVYARTDRVADGHARITVLTRLENDAATEHSVDIRTELLDASGSTVAHTLTHGSLPAASASAVEQTLTLQAPHLWNGLADPYLYHVRVSLIGSHAALIDRVELPFGVRTLRIDPGTGFWLNGRHLALHGVSRHQDRPDKGWAIDDHDIDQDMAMIREIGANTIRLAHYQHAQAAYNDADRIGFIIWAEIPLVDRSAPWFSDTTTPGLAANAELQLRELIRQNYNHPSIAVWSIANEVNLEAAKGRGPSHAAPLLEKLQAEVHREDPSRPATLADCCGSVPAEARPGLDTVAGITDVIGFNRYYGWYGGSVDDLGPDLDRLHQLYPQQAISVSEYGAGGALSQHTDDPHGGPIAAFGRPHPEEYQSWLLERSWQQIAARPYVWASWVWNMFDFSNEQRQEGDLTDTNDKGLVSFDRKTRKDAFYFFKANWSDQPFAWLTGRRHVHRPYPVLPVKAYSNLAELDLTLNGHDQGVARCQQGICLWPAVHLVSGDNILQVSGSENGEAVTDQIHWILDAQPGAYAIGCGTLSGARDATGRLWGSDSFFTGGAGHFRDLPSTSRGGAPGSVHRVAGRDDQTAYQSWRDGRFAYSIPVPDGHYRVTLHFFEPDPAARPGDRVFAVMAQGQGAGPAIDIVRDAGAPMTALTRVLGVVVANGELDLSFEPVRGSALVSGIEVVPAP